MEVAHLRELQWFGHTTRRPGSLAPVVVHGMVKGARGRGRPQATWLTDIAGWAGVGITACVDCRSRGE